MSDRRAARLLRAAPFVAAVFAGGLMGSSCVSALDLDERKSVIEALCKCDQDVPQLGGRCVEVLSERLDNVQDSTRQAWLLGYAQLCNGTCDNAFACYQQEGTCSIRSCTEATECCGFDDGAGTSCLNGECTQCRLPGELCTVAAECCGGDDGVVCVGVCEAISTGVGGPDERPDDNRP